MTKRKLRWLIRDGLLAACWYTGISRLYQRFSARRRAVISYHNVLSANSLEDTHVYAMDFNVDTFRRQLDYLTGNWQVLPAAELGSDRDGLLLSFDDGMMNAYTTIAPLLDERGITAMFAVCPALIDGEIHHIWRDHFYLMLRELAGDSVLLPMDGYTQPLTVRFDDINRLSEAFRHWVIENRIHDVYSVIEETCRRNGITYRRYDLQPERFHPMTWDMIRDLRARGHVIASHTMTHPVLSCLPREEKEREIITSRQRLVDELGDEVRFLVYPYGGPNEVDDESRAIARDSGYTHGFKNVEHPPGQPDAMNVARFGLPKTAWPPHLNARITGLKSVLRRKR